MWNEQAGVANNSCQYMTSNTCVQQTQSAHSTFRDGAFFKRQTLNWQNAAVPQQAGTSQHRAAGKASSYDPQRLHSNIQNSYTNPLIGNALSLLTNGQQVATQQVFHPHSGFINSATSPNMMKASPTYPQQDKSAHWNQQGVVHWKQSVNIQNGKVVSENHLLKSFFLNDNGESRKSVSAYAETAPSLQLEQEVCTSKLVSAGTHNRQTTHYQSPGQNGTQELKWAFSPSKMPPSYSELVSERNNSISTNSSNEKQFQVSCVTQKTQYYPSVLNSAHNHGEQATHPSTHPRNQLALNAAADIQEQMLSRQMIKRIADNLRSSFPATTGGSNYGGSQFVSNPNQNMQPVTVPESHSNASQYLLSNSRPNAFYATAKEDRSRNGVEAANAFLPVSDRVSIVKLAGSLSDTARLMTRPESVSSQRNKTDASGANTREILGRISSGKENDGSVHSSPGHTGVRAVAVVQPLLLESCQIANKHNSSSAISHSAKHTAQDESFCHPEKLLFSPTVEKEGSNSYSENLNLMKSNGPIMGHSAAFSDGTFVSSSESAVQQDLPAKQSLADETRPESTVNMHVIPNAQQSATSQSVSQSGDKDKNENPTDPKTCVFELSSVPIIPWTADTLTRLIQESEKAQLEHDRKITFHSASNILSMFWGGNHKNLVCMLNAGWYEDLMADVTKFCGEHLTSHSVILSQVKHSSEKQLKSCHVLKDNTVYSEPPYKSFWLNVNDQLDDIDKEFGFPWSLLHRLHTPESYCQPDLDGIDNSNLEQIENMMSNKVLSQTELEAVDSGGEKEAFTVEATSTQDTAPNVIDGDPYYSFEITVLPPEEAKIIFQQVQSKASPGMDMDNQPARVSTSSVESELPEGGGVTLNDSKVENNSVYDIQQICCIAKWMEIICKSQKHGLGKCKCNNQQSSENCADKNLDKEAISVQEEDNKCVIRSDSKFHKEEKNLARGKDEENIDKQMRIHREHSQILALTDNDHKYHSHSDNEPMNISQISIDSRKSSIILGENKDEVLSESVIEILSDSEAHCIQGQLGSTVSTQSCTSVSSDKEIQDLTSNGNEADSQISDVEENCGHTHFLSTDKAESPLETQSENKYIPPIDVNSKTSTCRKVADTEPVGSSVRAVQLILFGSATQDKGRMNGDRKRHFSSPEPDQFGFHPHGVSKPPEVLTVNLSPLKRKSSETVHMGEPSLKQRIREKWRLHFPQPQIKRRIKQKIQKCTFTSFSGTSLKKPKIVAPTNTKMLPASSEIRVLNGKTKHCLSRKRRKSLSDGLKHREQRMVTLKQPADRERNNGKNGSHAVMPLEENNVLRFNVLPSTFNFKDGSTQRKETNNPFPNKPVLVEEKDKSPSNQRETGTWCPNPEKKYCLQTSPTLRKTSGLFHEFQKKYKEKTQPSMEEQMK